MTDEQFYTRLIEQISIIGDQLADIAYQLDRHNKLVEEMSCVISTGDDGDRRALRVDQ
jgi:hypothetical protein